MIGANTVREEFKMEPAEFLRHIDNYTKNIASKDNFREILRKFDKLEKYAVDIWNGCITLTTKIGYFYLDIHFDFFEFDLDNLDLTKYEMDRYLKNEYYNLHFSTAEDFIEYKELKIINEAMEEVKAIIDGVIGGKNNE